MCSYWGCGKFFIPRTFLQLLGNDDVIYEVIAWKFRASGSLSETQKSAVHCKIKVGRVDSTTLSPTAHQKGNWYDRGDKMVDTAHLSFYSAGVEQLGNSCKGSGFWELRCTAIPDCYTWQIINRWDPHRWSHILCERASTCRFCRAAGSACIKRLKLAGFIIAGQQI